MPILWDAPLVAAVARELNQLLRGARLRAHRFLWEERALFLYFRSGILRWSLHPTAGWVVLLPPADPPADARPLAARVQGVEAPPDERVLRFRLEKLRGLSRDMELVVELMTNQWNALLLEGEAGRIRHLLWTRRQEERVLAVGHLYQPPPPSARMGRDGPLGGSAWGEILAWSRSEEGRRQLLDQVAYTSPLNLPALLAEEAADGSLPAGPLAGMTLWNRLRTLEDPQPCLLETSRDKQPYPYILQGFKCDHFSTLLDAISAVAGVAAPVGRSAVEGVLGRVERALHRARGRLLGLERELAGARDPGRIRDQANLLLTRLGEVPRGSSRVTLPGFDGSPVELTLDPGLSPRENAEALFGEASRLEKVLRRLPPLLAETEARVEELEELRSGVEAGTISPEEAARSVGEGAGPARNPSQEGERLPYRRYRSSGGLEIRVGRGSAHNDRLTFRHARPEDVWLHARDAAGAHVVLRWSEEGNPPARDLEEAAILAALGSRARSSGVVPVDWTRRKHVRKPRKAPPGVVIPARVQTLFVEPDPELPKRLRYPGEE